VLRWLGKRCKHDVHDTLTNGCSAFRVNYSGLPPLPNYSGHFSNLCLHSELGSSELRWPFPEKPERRVCEARYHWRLLCVELSTREAARAVSPTLALVSHGAEKTYSVEVAILRTVYLRIQGMRWGTILADHMTFNLKNDSTNFFKVLPILVSRVLVVLIGTSSFR
jgi:hypothetical protein